MSLLADSSELLANAESPKSYLFLANSLQELQAKLRDSMVTKEPAPEEGQRRRTGLAPSTVHSGSAAASSSPGDVNDVGWPTIGGGETCSRLN